MATSMLGVTSKKMYATGTLMKTNRNANQTGIRRSRQDTRRSTLQTHGLRSVHPFVSGACVAENSVGEDVKSIPQPIVKIDNESDPYATVVRVQFGDILGDLLDTVAALKNLDLNIVRAKFDLDKSDKHKFFITCADNGEKVTSSERLEEIRMTIINNLMYYHPESADELNKSFYRPARSSTTTILGPRRTADVPTTISITKDANEVRSFLELTTGDRPGLLVDIVGTLKDINVNVISAKAETIGKMAHDVFAVTYHGEALNRSMETLVENALYYYLARGDVEREESY